MSIVALAAKRCQPTSPNSIVAWSPEEEVAAATALRKELSLARSHQCRRLFVEREKRVSQERQARLALEEALARHEATTAERDEARKKAAAASVAASAAFFLASSRSAVVASWRARASSSAKRAWRSWDTRFSRSTNNRRHWCDRANESSFRRAVAAATSSSGLQATIEFGLVGWQRFAASATIDILVAQCFWFFGSCGGCAGSTPAKLLLPCACLLLVLCVASQQ